MTTTAVYPASLFTATDPLGSQKLSASTPAHSVQHTNVNDEIAAIEAALGVNPFKSTWTSSIAYTDVAARLSSYEVNAKDFGVKADGTTNDGDAMGLAIAFCLGAGAKLRLPAGTILMRTALGAVKMITLDFSGKPGVFEMYGMGMDSTKLNWSDDLGVGAYGFTLTNEGQTAYAKFHCFTANNTQYIAGALADPNGTVNPTSAGSFVLFGNRSIIENLSVNGWRYGIVSDGVDAGSGSTQNTDHVSIDYVDISNCYFGIYFLGNNRKSRDYIIRRALIHACQRAAFGCAANGEITDVTFDTFHLNACPFGFWKEGATPSDTGFLSNCHFIRCKWEGMGNGFIWAECTDGSGDFQRLTGFVEFHGIETNGQPTGGGGGSNDHGVGILNHTWRPWALTSMSRDGSGTVTATIASTAGTPTPKVGDSIVVWAASDNNALNSSVAGGFNIKTIVGTTYTWEQAGGIITGASGTAGPVIGVRGGSFFESDLRISMLTDPTTISTHPEWTFDLKQIDDVIITSYGGVGPPRIFTSGTLNGRKMSVLWREGGKEAFMCQANGSFAQGNILEQSANGNCVKSTLTNTVPCLGVALQAGATTISVASQIVTLKNVFIHSKGRNSLFAVGGGGILWGPGVITTSDPGNVALLCEDAANHGQAIACPMTAGTVYRIIGRSIQAASGGFTEYVACEPHMVKL